MSDKTKQVALPLRLAMRVEGDWWVAYVAKEGSMEGALELARMRMNLVRGSERREMFLALMRHALAEQLVEIFGVRPGWLGEQPAPERERSGSA